MMRCIPSAQMIPLEQLPALVLEIPPPMGVRGKTYRNALRLCMRLELEGHLRDAVTPLSSVPRHAGWHPMVAQRRPRFVKFQPVHDALVRQSYYRKKDFAPPPEQLLEKRM